MTIIAANSSIPGMTREESERFLESKLNLQIATIDEKDEPISNPYGFIMIKKKVNS
jgi:hypothetical protein